MKKFVPSIVCEFAKRIRNLLRARYRATDIKDLENIYRKNNEGLKSDTIMLRPGLKMRIHPDSRNAFEHFCYISPALVDEMDCFLD